MAGAVEAEEVDLQGGAAAAGQLQQGSPRGCRAASFCVCSCQSAAERTGEEEEGAQGGVPHMFRHEQAAGSRLPPHQAVIDARRQAEGGRQIVAPAAQAAQPTREARRGGAAAGAAARDSGGSASPRRLPQPLRLPPSHLRSRSRAWQLYHAPKLMIMFMPAVWCSTRARGGPATAAVVGRQRARAIERLLGVHAHQCDATRHTLRPRQASS